MYEPDIKSVLESSNPWWQAGGSFSLQSFEKKMVQEIKSDLKKPSALILIGPRQTGKTTIFHQLIDDLLMQVKDPRCIVYAPMDRLKHASLTDIIKLHQELTSVEDKCYYFFDEVHYDPDWAVNLKTLIDSQTGDKYLATGSSSTLILKDSAESGVGRFEFKSVSPFSFREFILKNGVQNNEIEGFSIQNNLEDMRNFIQSGDEIRRLALKRTIEPLLKKYLLFGGFPAQFAYEYNIMQWQNYLRLNYVSLTLYKDILSRYEVRDPSILEDLLFLVAEKTTLPLSYASLGKIFNIRIETVRQYLYYLEAAGLIIICDYYTKNISKRARRNKKFYTIDPGFTAALNQSTMLTDQDLSKNVETVVAAHLVNYLKKSTGLLNPRISYWKDKYEVDFVIGSGKSPIPVEVKYANTIRMDDIPGLMLFMEDYQIPTGIVITKDKADIWKKNKLEILLIPAWLVLCSL